VTPLAELLGTTPARATLIEAHVAAARAAEALSPQ
jgi:hypothetical protein